MKVKITAEDTSTVLTYTVTITRAEEDTSLRPTAERPRHREPIDGRLRRRGGARERAPATAPHADPAREFAGRALGVAVAGGRPARRATGA